ncbi:hypothetical protein CHS0354_029528 [Potamilus streckersoni]|uniref:EF-hand domain-containing protein n=1 Tax=Potamilus streckersoni TaxID=2493646 RepID=A0AAE0W4Z7_9BIVA|nr:hypothetical protein CHS0354_029528 [Potamilus streckersoni]
MGSGPSKRNHVRTKVQTVAKFQAIRKHSCGQEPVDSTETKITPETTSKEICLQISKKSITSEANQQLLITDTTAAWEKLRDGQVPSSENLPKVPLTMGDFRKVSRPKAVDDSDDEAFDIPYKATERVSQEETCHICGVYTGSEVFPCRICCRTYHTTCLQKIGRCQNGAAVAILRKATTPLGWSCYTCDDLSTLLTEEELRVLIDTFDKYDVNKDNNISLKEFLNYRQHRHKELFNTDMSKEEIEDEKSIFNLMDKSKTASISWWEFLNYESIKILQQRKKNSLVKMLSPREIAMARTLFQAFDKDGDGEITENEARKASLSWYRMFFKPVDSFHGYAIFSEENLSRLDHHIQQNVNFIMEADEDKNGATSWEEYLKNQALYILAARPNECQPPIGYKLLSPD